MDDGSALTVAQSMRPEFKEYDMSIEDIKIYRSMQLYQAISRSQEKFVTMFRKNEDPRTARWWNAFQKFHRDIRSRNVDKAMFFAAQIKMNKGKFVPNFLNADASFRRYERYMEQYEYEMENTDDFNQSKKDELDRTYNFINDWLVANDMPSGNYEAFFTYKEDFRDFIYTSLKFAIQGYLSPLFLSMSRSFGDIYPPLDRDIQDEVLPWGEIKKCRTILLAYPMVFGYARDKFGEKEICMSWKVPRDD